MKFAAAGVVPFVHGRPSPDRFLPPFRPDKRRAPSTQKGPQRGPRKHNQASQTRLHPPGEPDQQPCALHSATILVLVKRAPLYVWPKVPVQAALW